MHACRSKPLPFPTFPFLFDVSLLTLSTNAIGPGSFCGPVGGHLQDGEASLSIFENL